MITCYILKNKIPVPIDAGTEWLQFMDSPDKVVKKTYLIEVEISTVFLGLDQQLNSGPPLLFETMITGGPLDQYIRRYATWDQADAGHYELVRQAEQANRLPGIIRRSIDFLLHKL